MTSCVWCSRKAPVSRFLTAVFLILTACLLTSCSGAEASPLTENSKNHIWRFDDLDLTGIIGSEEGAGIDANGLYAADDRLCIVAFQYGPEGIVPQIVSIATDGGDAQVYPVIDPEQETGGFGRFEYADGVFHTLKTGSVYDEMTGMEHTGYTILRISVTGEILERAEIPYDAKQEETYIERIVPLADGCYLLKDSRGVRRFDPSTGEDRRIHDTGRDYFEGSLCRLGDDRIFFSRYTDDGYVMGFLDPVTGAVSGERDAPEGFFASELYPGTERDLYYYSGRDLYALDVRAGRTDKVIDFVASDVLTDSLTGVCETGDGRLAVLTGTYGEMGVSAVLSLATHVLPSEVKDKEEITLSCVYAGNDIMRRAVAYNRASSEYAIRVVDYSQYAGDGDWEAPYKKLNTDIVSGHIPDILVVDQELPFESYVSKGIIMDLEPLLRADERFHGDDFLWNVFDAYRIDGRMYSLVPGFLVYTGFMYSDLLDGKQSVSMGELQQIAASRGIATKRCFGAMTRESIFSMLLYMQGAEYVDLGTGRCAFDTPAFIDLLKLVEQFPEKIPDDEYMESRTAFRERTALLMLYGMGSFTDYCQMRYGAFGEPVTIVGIPGSAGSGSAILPQLQLAVTTSSKHPEAAWEFVGGFLEAEYQDGLNWGFPVRRDSLAKSAAKAKERPYYLDETGQKVEYDNTWWLNGQEVVIPPLSDEEEEKVTDFLSHCDRRCYSNSTVDNIIREEAEAFFQGQKSAEDVAAIIQSRAQIYVHENR